MFTQNRTNSYRSYRGTVLLCFLLLYFTTPSTHAAIAKSLLKPLAGVSLNSHLHPALSGNINTAFYRQEGGRQLEKTSAESKGKSATQTPDPTTAATTPKLDIKPIGTYKTGIFDEGAAEIGAYDPESKRLFIVNANGTLDVLDIKHPSAPKKLFSIEIEKLTGGPPNSVDVKKGIVAVAIEIQDEATETQLPGKVALFEASIAKAPTELKYLIPVGALPDMLTFTSDGTKILVANEGEPSETFDPEGSVSIIDITVGIGAAKVTTVNFSPFDGKEQELKAKGVRIFAGRKARVDFEPEYISISPDGKSAFITLQEANSFAVLDIAKAMFIDILPLGYKDHSRGKAALQQYTFQEPPIGKKLNGEDILFGGLSGLHFEKEENGKYIFVTVPDRGPNGEETPAGRPFLKPDYKAEVIRFALDKETGSISILEKIPLQRKEGKKIKPITGFPNIAGFDEKPIDEVGKELPYDPFGADMEGIVVAPDHSFWMVDEYRPAIYHFSREGMLLHRFVPKGTAALATPTQPTGTYGEETLPAPYANRRSNRGFEAVALDTEKDILYAFIQTPLANPNREASDNSNIIRILGIDPSTGNPVAEYIYPLEKPLLRATTVDKIGDATFDAKTGKIYVIERDDNATPINKKYIFEIDLIGATNLLAKEAPLLPADKTLEQYTLDELATLSIKPVYKTKVVNLPSLGYLPSDKPEGLTLLPDGSLALLNDNDFGLGGPSLSPVSLGIIRFTEGNTLDVSDRDGGVNLKNWPVLGMYMPDGVTSFLSNGQPFYITANEGDSRGEEERVGNSKIQLDPKAFPNADDLQSNEQLGRLEISSVDGDLDEDGDYDRLYSYGARSFTIWDEYGNKVFDSSDDLEKITAATYPDYFNASNTDNELDSRSDNKGPEPEGITIGQIDGRTYAFVGLERISGFMVYDVTDPTKVQFVTYLNNRIFTGDIEAGTAGDLGPEGILFIDSKESPNGKPLLVVTNEISGSTSIYSIEKDIEVFDLKLINSTADTVITSLKDGAIIDFARLMTTKLNIGAIVSPRGVGSVLFELNGKKVNVDNPRYFSLFGDINGNYKDWTPQLGDYILKATPYSGTHGQGEAGIPLTIRFKVIYSAQIAGFTLVNAENRSDIKELKDGEVINLKALPTNRIAIRANASPEKVGSVAFSLNEKTNFTIENVQPYALLGNEPNNIDYKPWTPKSGTYTITAKPYAEAHAKGVMGKPATITLTIIDQPLVTELLLVNSGTGEEVGPIGDGDVIDLNKKGITNFNVRAKVNPEKIGYVEFTLNDKKNVRENQVPYELFGDGGWESANLPSVDGVYSVKATPYFHTGKGSYVPGTPLTVQFTIQHSGMNAQARIGYEVNGAENRSQVNIYPNPVKDVLTINLGEAVEGELSIEIVDILGKKAYYASKLGVSGRQEVKIDIASLPARFYILRLNASNLNKSIRFVKE